MAGAWDFIYRIPTLMGYGAYWALNDVENKMLTDRSIDAVNAIPSDQRKHIMKAINSWAPMASFLGAVAIVTYPRVMYAQLELAQKKGNVNATVFQPGPPNNQDGGPVPDSTGGNRKGNSDSGNNGNSVKNAIDNLPNGNGFN